MLRQAFLMPRLCLQALQSYAKRPVVQAEVQRLTDSFFQSWQGEIATVRAAFEVARQNKDSSLFFPATVHQAHQLMQLRRRLGTLITRFQVHAPPSACPGLIWLFQNPPACLLASHLLRLPLKLTRIKHQFCALSHHTISTPPRPLHRFHLLEQIQHSFVEFKGVRCALYWRLDSRDVLQAPRCN